jgi:NDP-sugar pyrophosphorylase family protein
MAGNADTALIVLAGGKGTRIASLDPSRPKPMLLTGGKPFLHWLVRHYRRFGYSRFVLSTCHLADVIESYPWKESFPGAAFECVRESAPLGTGGAIRQIFEKLGLEQAWVINGDTLLTAPLPTPPSGVEALYTVMREEQLFDAKPNLRGKDGKIIIAAENDAAGHFFDAGAVFLTKNAVDRYSGRVPCSLHELLRPAVESGRVGYAEVPGTCYDIGTPERLRRFETEYLSHAS